MSIEKKIELLKLMRERQHKISGIFQRDGYEKTAPKKAIIIKRLDVMPYDRDGMHATGRRIYAYNALVGYMTGWDEYTDGESLFYKG